jgi:arylsulfatase A-like enzyme
MDRMSAPPTLSPPGKTFPVLVAACFALVAGLAELIVIGQRKILQHEFIGANWHLTWMTPLSYLLLLIPFGLALVIASRVLPRVVTARVSIFTLGLVSAFSFFFLFFPALHRIAIIILAVGTAVQATRMVAARPAAFQRAARRIVGVGIISILGLALGSVGWAAVRERRTLSVLPPAAAGAPNLLLIVLDTVRAMSMSLYGHTVPNTPQLERLAQRGVLFRNAFATSPWTFPSHATMFTGLYPSEMEAGWTAPLADDYTTLAETLAARGYATAGFVANLQYCTQETGIAQGFAHYEDIPLSLSEIVMSSSLARVIINNPTLRSVLGYHDILGRKTATDITNAFLDWTGQSPARPFFAFLNYYDAHEPYLPPAPFDTAFGGVAGRNVNLIRHLSPRMAERSQKRGMSETERRAEERAYDAAIAYVDAELGRLFDELDRRGLMQNTVVIVTSDHGELFGEHDLFSHGNSLYAPTLHVPLLIASPVRLAPAAAVVDDYVTLRDLPATALDLLGLPTDGFPGSSLARALGPDATSGSPLLAGLRPAPNQPEWFPSTKGIMTSLVEPPYHYIRNGDGEEELYQIVEDPSETSNLTHLDSLLAVYRAAHDARWPTRSLWFAVSANRAK